jgi:hypothetical protein
MALGTHPLYRAGIGSIQIDENITCILVFGIGLDMDVTSFAIASAQETNGIGIRQLGCGPQPFSRKGAW